MRLDDMAKNTDIGQIYDQEFFDDIEPASLRSSEVVVPILVDLFHPQSVVDVGCGTGGWLLPFKKLGLTKILGIDGGDVHRSLLIEPDEFVPCDLTHPLSIEASFDLALCIEVAEHLPAHSARVLVDSLVGLAPLICFSSAVPGSGGTGIGHLNEQWPAYWEQKFKEVGYLMFDPIRPLIWQDNRVAWYYRENLFVLARQDIVAANPVFQQLASRYAQHHMMLLHDSVLAYHLALLPSLKRLPGLFVRALTRILRSILATEPRRNP